MVEITCRDSEILWERISQLKGDLKITGVKYDGRKLIEVTFETEEVF